MVVVVLSELLFIIRVPFPIDVGVLDLDSLFSDLFFEFLWIFEVVVVDEFVNIFMRFLLYLGETLHLLHCFSHLFTLEVLKDVLDGSFFECALFSNTVLDILGNFLDLSESYQSINQLRVNQGISV
eukprot:TRINITY_DN28384_c0_g1_i1.p1 TRINITY_DN28384_c0_g1~~TRINITY_DN28384_c0_g1_i1.p1  ORF type:complete len:126 (-),score=15.61 TRINITY_DN28384_c0_g1_i1:14-391(-)